MRSARIALVSIGLLHFVLAMGFFFRQTWATSLWPLPDTPLSYAFIAEVIVLFGAGILLVLKVPNTLPWNLSPESSVLYGWVFIGLAFYYLYAVLCPQWIHALGPLLGFLVYDLVLFSPLFARFGNLQPEHIRGQVAASVIIIFSAAVGVYYLFVNPSTRLGTQAR